MGAGRQRWWRDYERECREWSDRDVASRTIDEDGTETIVYKNGHTHVNHGDGIRLRYTSYCE